MVLLLLGLAGVVGGGTSIVLTLSYLDGCTEDCQGAALSGTAGIIVLAAGVLALIAWGVRFVSEREGRKIAARDRRLRELELRLYRG